MTMIASEENLVTKKYCTNNIKTITDRQTLINENQIIMGEDIKHIKKGIEEIKEVMKDFDSRFAGKWVENLLLWGAGIIGTICLTGLVYLVWKIIILVN